jgi:hypothetical protein
MDSEQAAPDIPKTPEDRTVTNVQASFAIQQTQTAPPSPPRPPEAKPGWFANALALFPAAIAVALGVVVVWTDRLGPLNAARILYAGLALVASAYYGWFARSIFTSKEGEDRRDWPGLFPYKIHQFWLNFTGSMVGWGSAWNLRRFAIEGLEHFGLSHALLALVAFLGVTGLLPYTLVGLATSIATAAEKLIGFSKQPGH